MDLYRIVSDLVERGGSGALCTITVSDGSTPRHAGSKMLVYPDGTTIGTVGGGEVESRVVAEALAALGSGMAKVLSYNMVDPGRGDPGICGGHLEVFVEPILPQPLIVVIGGGHVGQAVTHLARWLGFRVAVSDDRAEFASPGSNPDAQEFYPVPMAELPRQFSITSQTYLILTTRGAPIDIEGLPELLKTNAGYIGLIGSKRRWLTTKKALLEMGVPAELVERVHAPIGIELNAETPEEIAVSILAEIIMLRNGGSGKIMKI